MCALLLALILDLTAAGAPNTAPDVPLQATSLGVWYGKPPLAFNRFDVTVRNPSAQARWMILPSTFPNQGRIEPAPGVSDVIELQIFRLSSKVLFVKAVGGEFQAVKLPGHGTIKLRELAIDSWWEKRPDSVALELIVARSVKLGARPLDELTRALPVSASGVEIKAPWDLSGDPDVTMWHPPGERAVPVTFDIESRARITVPLSKREFSGSH